MLHNNKGLCQLEDTAPFVVLGCSVIRLADELLAVDD